MSTTTQELKVVVRILDSQLSEQARDAIANGLGLGEDFAIVSEGVAAFYAATEARTGLKPPSPWVEIPFTDALVLCGLNASGVHLDRFHLTFPDESEGYSFVIAVS